jgi:hypothetical protein
MKRGGSDNLPAVTFHANTADMRSVHRAPASRRLRVVCWRDHLTAMLFGQRGPEIAASEPTGADRRRAPRIERNSTARLFILPSGRLSRPIDATVVDYSEGGVGLICDTNLLVGQRYIIREPFLTRKASSLYTVVRSDNRGDGTYGIGLRLDGTLVDEHEPPDEMPAEPERKRTPSDRVRTRALLFTFAMLATARMLQLLL